MTASLDIVPPRRLGMLLAGARAERGLTVAQVAARTGVAEPDLVSLEAGALSADAVPFDEVLAGYGTSVEELVPTRRQVLLDLEQGELLVADEATAFDGVPTPDDVLGAYLSLVYSLRHAAPGSPLVLRGFDVAVLARVLDLSEREVETRLVGLMQEPTEEIGRLTRLLRSRLAVPIAGAVVIATALGTVLVLRSDDRPSPAPTSVARTEVPPPELGPAATLERGADGSTSPVEAVAP